MCGGEAEPPSSSSFPLRFKNDPTTSSGQRFSKKKANDFLTRIAAKPSNAAARRGLAEGAQPEAPCRHFPSSPCRLAALGSVPASSPRGQVAAAPASKRAPSEARGERSTCAQAGAPAALPSLNNARSARCPRHSSRGDVFKQPEPRSGEQERCPAAARGRRRGAREREQGGDPNPESEAVRPGPTCWRSPSRRALPLGQTLRSWGARGAPLARGRWRRSRVRLSRASAARLGRRPWSARVPAGLAAPSAPKPAFMATESPPAAGPGSAQRRGANRGEGSCE